MCSVWWGFGGGKYFGVQTAAPCLAPMKKWRRRRWRYTWKQPWGTPFSGPPMLRRRNVFSPKRYPHESAQFKTEEEESLPAHCKAGSSHPHVKTEDGFWSRRKSMCPPSSHPNGQTEEGSRSRRRSICSPSNHPYGKTEEVARSRRNSKSLPGTHLHD